MGHEERNNPNAILSMSVREARGRELKEGDEIILAIPGPIYFRVAAITPVLDPGAPPGLMQVHVGCMLTFGAKRGAVNREFVRVRTEQEAGPMQFKLLDAQPAAGGIVEGPDPRD